MWDVGAMGMVRTPHLYRVPGSCGWSGLCLCGDSVCELRTGSSAFLWSSGSPPVPSPLQPTLCLSPRLGQGSLPYTHTLPLLGAGPPVPAPDLLMQIKQEGEMQLQEQQALGVEAWATGQPDIGEEPWGLSQLDSGATDVSTDATSGKWRHLPEGFPGSGALGTSALVLAGYRCSSALGSLSLTLHPLNPQHSVPSTTHTGA